MLLLSLLTNADNGHQGGFKELRHLKTVQFNGIYSQVSAFRITGSLQNSHVDQKERLFLPSLEIMCQSFSIQFFSISRYEFKEAAFIEPKAFYSFNEMWGINPFKYQ